MDVTEFTQNPAMMIAGAVGILLVLWMLFSLRGRPSRSKAPNRAIAAVEAERDVLRANHAVEIAALERKLADVQGRSQKDMDAVFRLREMEQALEAARAQIASQDAALAAAGERLTVQARDLESERSRHAELSGAADARERAEGELSRQGETLAEFRREAAAAATRLGAAAAARDEAVAAESRAVRERDEARAALEAERAASAALRAESAAHDSTDIADLKLELARLSGAVGERDSRLETLGAREKSANDALSRLAYESDALKERVDVAERTEREVKAEIEKKEALLELRLQKIYALEAEQREAGAVLDAMRRRAEAAESEARAARQAGGDGDAAYKSRIGALEAELTKAGGEEQRLRAELEELRGGSHPSYAEAREIAEALSAAQAEAEELRAEVDRLRKASAHPVTPAEIDALREAIRVLGDRFIGDGAPAETAPVEPSLAEKIRAFKASRDATVRRPLRIAALKETRPNEPS